MKQPLHEQVVPLLLTVITFLGLCGLLYLIIVVLNVFPAAEKIQAVLHPQDIFVGMIIYLKTAIDFAIFIGNLMHANPGYKKRIAIELGTAMGNAAGTIVILVIWNFFREVELLLALMIFIASLVLLRMAEESLEDFLNNGKSKKAVPSKKIHASLSFLEEQLDFFNKLFKPIIGRLIPNMSMTNPKPLLFWNLFWFSFTVPFILGLDDFAGYIPLFSVVNVFGFSVGVFLGHMILNASLFVSPDKTSSIVRHPLVLAIGGLAFVIIAALGIYEVLHILLHVISH